ncbi:hypothetical protein OPT61_g10251 [Boeremia exigua]|uniref:Uncharacterized protein n=1 Tax=Boeremia exigua TaxID=749465 RepID=A0ACC2HRG6_9PLEO|nr:hypothetical protein OPT61_g10251 [Boeremia exigua]
MLRLKPSELTLTPEDVDEAFQRMARRKQARDAAAQAQRRPRRPPPLRLMPGAQRSVRSAVTDLGNVPLLRPQPQQAIIAHVDDDSDGAAETTEPQTESLTGPSEAPPQTVSASPAIATPSLRHSTRLPFRPGPRRELDVEQEPLSSPHRQTDEAPVTGPETNVAGQATPGREVDSTADTLSTLEIDPSATPANLRGGASRSRGHRSQSAGQDAPSSRQTQVSSPAHQPDSDDPDSDVEYPMRYLSGYFDRNSLNYTFEELVPRVPHTEPLRRTSQPQLHARSRSSGAPPPRLFAPTPNAPLPSTGEDVFGSAAARPRQHSSEMSNMSLAYSYYELPESRQSSGGHSSQGSLPQAQYDGAGRGIYRSVRLSDAQAPATATMPPMPNPSTFPPSVPGFAVSPLPGHPYARPHAGSVGGPQHLPLHHHVSWDSAGRATHPNAIAAAMGGRASPLEALTDQLGRESQRIGSYQGPYPPSAQPGIGPSPYYHPGPGVGAHGAYGVYGTYASPYGPHSPAYGSYGPHPPAYGSYGPQPSAYGSYGLQPSAYGPHLSAYPHVFPYSTSPGSAGQSPGMFTSAMADDPYTRGVSAHAGRPYGSPAQPVPAANYAAPPLPRGMQGGRSSQRSSENAPVGPPVPGELRTASVQDQVSAFEQMNHAVRARHMQRMNAPPLPPGRRNDELPSPMPAAPRARPRGPRRRAALSPSQGNAGRRSIRMDPRLQNQENSGEAEMQMMRQEFESVRTRYDERQQGDVMDETPPRIGRVERHM